MSENLWSMFDGMATQEQVKSEQLKSEKLEGGTYDLRFIKMDSGITMGGLPKINAMFIDEESGRACYPQITLASSNPDYTPTSVARGITFINAIADEKIEYVSMSKLLDDIERISKECKNKIVRATVSYDEKDLEKKKYPRLAFIEPTKPLEDTDVPF